MCEIGEDAFMVPESTATGTVTTVGSCSKCQNTGTLYKLQFRAEECRDCFLAYARHKFRAALGAAKVLPRNADVLLVVDGTAETLVLLDMLHYAQTQNTFKRLHCSARVLCLDDRLEEETWNLDAFRDLQQRYAPFEFHAIQLGAPLSTLQPLNSFVPWPRERNELVQTLHKIRSLTARQDYVQHQRKRLMAMAAQQLQCSHVFEAIISSELASHLLTAIALGRGGSSALDVALLDDRLPGGVVLLRPLKDLTDQEVSFYLQAQQLKPFTPKKAYGQECGHAASLQNLTMAFVGNLQQHFASTVSTVFRTGDKIAPKLGTSTSCRHCQSPLDSEDSDTLLAIEYSRAVSEAGATLAECGDSLEKKAKAALSEDDELCHACRNIQKELKEDILK